MESYLVYLVARAAFAFFRALPRRIAVWILDSLAALSYYIDARHRHIAQVNLVIAFPELSERKRKSIARRSFQNVARNLLEISRLPDLSKKNISSLVQYDAECGLNNFEAARARGKGILYVTGHFSAWELLPAAHALHGHPLSFVTRPLDNAHLEQYMVRVREAAGNEVLAKKRSARQILERLNAKGAVGILMDQNTSLQEGVFANLFGLPAATTASVALLALRTDATVLPGFLTPAKNGSYLIKFLPPVSLIRTGDKDRDVRLNTELFNSVMEKIIRSQPDSWLWGHRRWKNQPAENPQDIYGLSRKDLTAFLAQKKQAS